MAKRRKKKQEEPEDIKVRLKPLLGIEPGVYLTVIYGIILAVILFFILVYPGIKHNGSRVTVITAPGNVRVLVDGRYAGATPCTVFVEKGRHTITLERRYFVPLKETLPVGGRVFGSLLFPRKMNISRTLELQDAGGFLNASFKDACAWSLIDIYHANYQKPPVLADTVNTLVDAGASPGVLDTFLDSAAALVESEPMLKDYLTAIINAERGNGVVSPANLLNIVQEYIHYLDSRPAFLFWLPEALSSDHHAIITDSEWFRHASAEYVQHTSSAPDDMPVKTGEISVHGMSFVGMSSGSFILGKNSDTEYPVSVAVQGFYILDREVTRSMYADFLDENPGWRRSNLERLKNNGLVTEDYLLDFDTPGAPDMPVRYISYYAADAFCRWLEKSLPAELKGMRVRLPREEEWEWAAVRDNPAGGVFQAAGISGPAPAAVKNNLGIFDLSGNLWEWCENWYYPADYLLWTETGKRPNLLNSGVEKVVRGGSWANPADEVTIRNRGSQPAEWCTAFTGFRPIIVQE